MKTQTLVRRPRNAHGGSAGAISLTTLPERQGHDYVARGASKEKGSALDPNHNVFLLIDNGDTGDKAYKCEIKFRAEFEAEAHRYFNAPGQLFCSTLFLGADLW